MRIDLATLKNNRWLRLAIVLTIPVLISLGLAVPFNWLLSPLKDDLRQYAWLAYLIILGASLLSNMTVIAPVYVFTTLMVTAAGIYNPALIALSAAVGGTLGEMSGYFAGYLGKKILFDKYPEAYEKVSSWVNRYGIWAISVLAFQPVIPFDMAGMVAGATKMPVLKFLIGCFLGKFPKYLIVCFFYSILKDYLPFF